MIYMFCLYHFSLKCIIKKIIYCHTVPPLRRLYQLKIFFFIIRFYEIMHRTSIVQNQIISIFCSCHFFCPANIYRPSLGKVGLGRPNPNLSQSLNIYFRKKNILLRIACTTMYHCPIFNFHLF